MIRIPLSVLAAALPGARLEGKTDLLIHRLTADSRDVKPGDLFAAVRGRVVDGHRYAAGAIQRGAVAVMIDQDVQGLESFGTGVLRVPQVASALMRLAPMFYNQPSQKLSVVGVTGTNGKTTFTHLLRAILECCREGRHRAHCIGVVGTIQHEIAGRVVASHNTTPMAWDLQRLLYEMVEQDCDVAVMEVSSHALAEDRIEGTEFDVAVFTNLTPEHLDFHQSMEQYAEAKQKLFARLAQPGRKPGPKCAVVNADDPQGSRMASAALGARVITYALDRPADVTAEAVTLSGVQTVFRLKTAHGTVPVKLQLLGRFNIYNALAAAAVALALGAPLRAIQQGLGRVKSVPGRLERIGRTGRVTVLVDYAHTPDALAQVLKAVRPLTSGRVMLVFGCGGNRDSSKRAPMGELAAREADWAVVTSDNPRQEDPQAIIGQILQGVARSGQADRVQVEPDRRLAIRMALRQAKSGDLVLIAGKGHETYQMLKDRTLHFDDRRVASQEWARLKQGKT